MNKTFTHILSIMLLSLAFPQNTHAQQAWDVDMCMRYAVEHNRTVRQLELESDNYGLDRIKAIGNFLPGISGGTSLQYNWGRSVDPETNTYNNISTFNNSYSLQASLPIFNGGNLINTLRRSKVSVLLGKAALEEARDNIALETFQAYIDALYYYGTVKLAREKVIESDSLLYKTRRQEQLGLKGMADVAQMEAQAATDEYNLTTQSNLFETAMLTLKQKMNYPLDDNLLLDTLMLDNSVLNMAILTDDPLADIFEATMNTNPTLRQSEFNMEIANLDAKISWANVLPSISLNGGINSSYFKELNNNGYSGFWNQLENNFGQYVGISISIPIFNGMSGITGIRKARNSHRIAIEQYEAQKEELQKLVTQAVLDKNGFLKECMKMEKKVEADSIAYHVTRRKYEEGLMTSLDVQTSAATLLESEVALLQCKLSYVLKCRLVEYYKGHDIIATEI